MIKSKKQMFILLGVFVLVLCLFTITYAFFNYTRTGSANVVKVGRIYFNTEQTNINLDNIFPIDSSEVATDTENVSTATIHVTGDTTYSDGIEYLVSAVDINNTVNNKTLPISVDINYVASENKTIGTSDENYYINRGGNSSIYKVLSNKVYLADNNKLLVGYIAPNETGIDGTITIKAYIDKDLIAISDTYPEYSKYIVNPNASEEDINDCASYLLSQYLFNNNESAVAFCTGTGQYGSKTLQELVDGGTFYSGYVTYLAEHNILLTEYTNDTTNEWVNGRIVLTTSEWNSINLNALSFKIKVEANEGIWAGKPGNSVYMMSNLIFHTDNVNTKVKEIYFDDMTKTEMHQRYEMATYKEDITYNNEGEVLAWLETNSEDETKYTMYIASDGETLLTDFHDFFSRPGLQYAEKIVFNNLNTRRVTNMSGAFYFQNNLKEIDVTSFDTSNVTNMNYFVYACPKIEKVTMNNLDLRKVKTMIGMFYSDGKLEEINMDGIKTRDIEGIDNMFYQDYSLKSINLEGFGGDNLESIYTMFNGCTALETANLKNFNFGQATLLNALFSGLTRLKTVYLSGAKMSHASNIYSMFNGCTALEIVYLDGVDTSSVTSLSSMFNGCTNLTTIYVTEEWDVSNATSSDNMFNGCTSLVGGNETHYDSSKVDKTMAVIDNNDHEGYLTLKTS